MEVNHLRQWIVCYGDGGCRQAFLKRGVFELEIKSINIAMFAVV